ncbi:uncharacterized protein LOC111086383 isoform X1 [Limulus polyphemus]|uniref:Uncharacterized protein LOC111086383 isoform X1 n=1 Tax=Limulus polyphemus TaxID=6850 RepID=A0ABM1SM52_LIMPO|nr:uncharacterized protein LOC111086383 isoform X1 [Limulus polyphemus]
MKNIYNGTLSGLQKLILDYHSSLQKVNSTIVPGLSFIMSTEPSQDNRKIVPIETEDMSISTDKSIFDGFSETIETPADINVTTTTEAYSATELTPVTLTTPIHTLNGYIYSKQLQIKPSDSLPVALLELFTKTPENKTDFMISSSYVGTSAWNRLLTYPVNSEVSMDRESRVSQQEFVTAPTIAVSADQGLHPATGNWNLGQSRTFQRKDMEVPRNQESLHIGEIPSLFIKNQSVTKTPLTPMLFLDPKRWHKPNSSTSFVSKHHETRGLSGVLNQMILNNPRFLGTSTRHETRYSQVFPEDEHQNEPTQQETYRLSQYSLGLKDEPLQQPSFFFRQYFPLLNGPQQNPIFFRQAHPLDVHSLQEHPIFIRQNHRLKGNSPQQSSDFKRDRPLLSLDSQFSFSTIAPTLGHSETYTYRNDNLFLVPGYITSNERKSLRKDHNVKNTHTSSGVTLENKSFLSSSGNLSNSGLPDPQTDVLDNHGHYVKIPNSSVSVDLEGASVFASTFFPHLNKNNVGTINPQTNPKYEGKDEYVTKLDTELSNSRSDQEINYGSFKLTTEHLAYTLIGSCCGLSVVCLIVIAVTLKCRKLYVRRKLRHVKEGDLVATEIARFHNQSYCMQDRGDYMTQLNLPTSSSSKSCESCICNCRSDPFTVGARNSDPLSFHYQRYSRPRKLPFGAASALHFETLGINSRVKIKRTPFLPHCEQNRNRSGHQSCETVSTDSHCNYSDCSSISGSQECPCINSSDLGLQENKRNTSNRNSWIQCACMLDEINQRRTKTPKVPQPSRSKERYEGSLAFDNNCRTRMSVSSSHLYRTPAPLREALTRFTSHCSPLESSHELSQIETALYPPVSGSNYLSNSDGVIFWSSNDERLI